jgi:hypothetical protein
VVEDSAAQSQHDQHALPEVPVSDSALLEDALQEAIDAHAAGLLAAPFGVDEMALKRARRRALRSDIRRLLAQQEHGPDGA